jgi:hypothetical protein
MLGGFMSMYSIFGKRRRMSSRYSTLPQTIRDNSQHPCDI